MSARKSAVAARSLPARVLRLCFRAWSSRCEREYRLIAKLLWPGAERGPRIAGRTHCRMLIFGARRAAWSADLGAPRDFSRHASIAAAYAAPAHAGATFEVHRRRTHEHLAYGCQDQSSTPRPLDPLPPLR